jgi:hypothetical protein
MEEKELDRRPPNKKKPPITEVRMVSAYVLLKTVDAFAAIDHAN